MAGRSLRLRNWQRWLLGGCLALAGCQTGNHFPSFPPIPELREAYREANAPPASPEPPPRWAIVPAPSPGTDSVPPELLSEAAPEPPAQPSGETQPLVLTVKLRVPDPPTLPCDGAFAEPKPLHLPLATEAASRPLVVDYATALRLACGDDPQVRTVGHLLRNAFSAKQPQGAVQPPALGACRGFNNARGELVAATRAEPVADPPRGGAGTNEVLLETALTYLRLLEAYQQRAVAVETLAQVEYCADLTGALLTAGRVAQADCDRARAELSFRRNNVLRSEEAVLACSTRLGELLRAPADVRVIPREDALVPFDLGPATDGVRPLIQASLRNRPESAGLPLVALACLELSQPEGGEWLPSSFSGLNTTDATSTGSGSAETRDEQLRQMDRIARQVVEARGQVQIRRQQVFTAEDGVRAATDGLKRELGRLREGQGTPSEALRAVQTVDLAWHEYVRTVAAYDEAQFRLFWATGCPVTEEAGQTAHTPAESHSQAEPATGTSHRP